MKVLLVDDEESQRAMLSEFLATAGFETKTAASGKEALAAIQAESGRYDAVITDLSMPDLTGIDLMQKARAQYPDLDFILITAHGTVETAIHALKAGAFDYLLKPLELDEVLVRVKKLFSMKGLEKKAQRLERENRSLRGDVEPVAKSASMKALLADLEKAAKTNASVLLTGETGTGKEVLARFLHAKSPRAGGPFVAVNCSAIPENLLESEFFGHEKGAFTGAERRNSGFFETADGGTLFLDELGEMEIKLQPKILRAIEDRKIRRVGGNGDIAVDVRFVAATNQDLKARVAAKTFREDLFFRLNVVHFQIPPLRERRDDVPALVETLVKRHAASLNVKVDEVADTYLEALAGYSFPGNVRELANIVERSLIFAAGRKLTADQLPADVRKGAARPATFAAAAVDPGAGQGSLADRVAAFEASAIRAVLDAASGDVDQAARTLDVARSTLYSKMSKYGIKEK